MIKLFIGTFHSKLTLVNSTYFISGYKDITSPAGLLTYQSSGRLGLVNTGTLPGLLEKILSENTRKFDIDKL